MNHKPPPSPGTTGTTHEGNSPWAYRLLLLYIVSLAVMMNWDLPLVHRKLQPSDIIFMGLAVAAVPRLLRANWSQAPFGAIFVLAFPLGLIPSLLVTQAPALSAVQYAGFLYLVAVFGFVHLLVSAESRWWGVARVWFWSALGVMALAWLGWVLHNGFGLKNPFFIERLETYKVTVPFLAERARSTLNHPAMFATYLQASLAPLFLYVRHRRWSKASIGAVLAAVVLTAALTKTRPLAGVMLSVALLWWWCVPGSSRVSRWAVGTVASGLAALALVTCFWWLLPLRASESPAAMHLAPNWDRPTYYYFHSAALRIGRDHPWAGVGLEQYNAHMVSYIDWEKARDGFRWADPELKNQFRQPMDPHSTYLGYWAEAGLPGVVGLAVLFGGLFWTFLSATRGRARVVPSVFLAVFCGFALDAYFLDIMTHRVFWAVMALGTVALRHGVTVAEEVPSKTM
jgi:O-antigen ligase